MQRQTLGKLSCMVLGPPSGIPVLILHGFPASSNQSLFMRSCAETHGLRIIVPDRPGYGRSPGLETHDYDLASKTFLDTMDAAGHPSFHLLGKSGGAPNARHLALHAPSRVRSLITVAGLGITEGENLNGMGGLERWGLRTIKYLPQKMTYQLLQIFFPLWKKLGPERLIEQVLTRVCLADQECLKDPLVRQRMVDSYNDSTINGIDGVYADVLRYVFCHQETVGEFSCPFILFHGTEDRVVPYSMSVTLAKRFPKAELLSFDGDGHYSLTIGKVDLVAVKIVSLEKERIKDKDSRN